MFEDLLAAAQDAIVMTDAAGLVTFWNGGAADLYGWTADEAMGGELDALLHSEFSDEVVLAGVWEGDVIRITRGGRRLTVGVRRTVLDELTLEIARPAVSTARLTRLVHRYNNAIGAIQGFAAFALEDVAGAARADIEAIQRAAYRAAGLTRELDAISRAGPPATVLVVDDDPAIGEAAARALTAAGYVVVVAASGEDALRLSLTSDLDLVLTDLELRDMTGEELVARLRQERPGLPAVFTARAGDSGSPDDSDVLDKPVTAERLLAAVVARL